MQLQDKVIIVTGGGQGLGRAMAEYLASKGARLALVDLNQERLDEAVAACKAGGGEARAYLCNVANEEQVSDMVTRVAEDFGGLHGLVNNAGILRDGLLLKVKDGEISKMSLAQWQAVIDVNLTGVFATMQAAAAVMKPQKSGRIICTASIAGMQTSSISGYAYSATKAAVIHLVHLAAAELAAHNIRVNGIAPGPFLTNIAGGRMFREPERVDMMAATTGLNRVADPAELKGLALLLASDASSFITGQVVPIDGGSLVK